MHVATELATLHATPAARGKPRTRHYYHLQHKQFCSVRTSEMCLLCTHEGNVAVSYVHATHHPLALFLHKHRSTTAMAHGMHWFRAGSQGCVTWVCPACRSVSCILKSHHGSYVVVETAVQTRPSALHEARHVLALGEERKPLFLDMPSMFEDWRDGRQLVLRSCPLRSYHST